MHQIFMLALAGLREEGEVAQVLVVSQLPPLVFLVFLLFPVLPRIAPVDSHFRVEHLYRFIPIRSNAMLFALCA